MRTTIPFLGTQVEAAEPRINAQRIVNYIPVLEGTAALSPVALYTRPALRFFADSGYGPCRSHGVQFLGELFFVSGQKLLSLHTGGTITIRGQLNTFTGRVSIADAGRDYILLADGTNHYYYGGIESKTFGVVTDPDLKASSQVVQIRGVFVSLDKDSDIIRATTNIDNPTEWSALAWATAERKPDKGKALAIFNDTLWVIGENTSEGFYLKGSKSFPFSPILTMPINWGTRSPWSIAQSETAVYWLASSFRGGAVVASVSASGSKVVSNPDIEAKFSKYELEDAIGYCYREAGSTFYNLTFPTSDKTWTFNEQTGVWVERKTYGIGRWGVSGYGFLEGDHIVGDFSDGKFYIFDNDLYEDDDGRIERIVRSQPIQFERRLLHHNKVEIVCRTGIGNSNPPADDPELLLRWSDDGGQNWSAWLREKVGKIGAHETRVEFYGLGSATERTYELMYDAPTNFTLISALVDGTAGIE